MIHAVFTKATIFKLYPLEDFPGFPSRWAIDTRFGTKIDSLESLMFNILIFWPEVEFVYVD